MISFTKTASAFAAVLLLWTASAFAQSVPDDTRVIPTAIPQTDLIIDVPVTWEPLPPELSLGESMFSFFDGDGSADEELAAFGHFGEGGGAFMLISRGEGFARAPLEELEIMAQGIRLSRVLTWIVGAGMQITVAPQPLPLGAEIEAATMSFLSGQSGDHDELSMTILRTGEETFLIVDIAQRGADEVQTLRAMRRSIRLQD